MKIEQCNAGVKVTKNDLYGVIIDKTDDQLINVMWANGSVTSESPDVLASYVPGLELVPQVAQPVAPVPSNIPVKRAIDELSFDELEAEYNRRKLQQIELHQQKISDAINLLKQNGYIVSKHKLAKDDGWCLNE